MGGRSRAAPGISSRVQSGVAPKAPQDETQERETELANVQEQVQLHGQEEEQAKERRYAQVGGQEQKHAFKQPCGRYPHAMKWLAAEITRLRSELHSTVLAGSRDSCNAAESELPTAELPAEEAPSSVELTEQAADSEAGVAGLPALATSKDFSRKRCGRRPEMRLGHDRSPAADLTGPSVAVSAAAAAAVDAQAKAGGPQMLEVHKAHDLSVSGKYCMEISREQQSSCSFSGGSLATRIKGAAAREVPKPQAPGTAAKRRKRAAQATSDAVSRRCEDDPFGLWQS